MSAAKELKYEKGPTALEVERNVMGIRTPGQRKQVRRILLRFAQRAAEVMRTNYQAEKALDKKARRPCDTCALAPGTWSWRGFVSTTYALVEALTTHKDKQVFICHANQPRHCHNEIDPKKAIACEAFLLVGHDKYVRDQALQAHLSIDKVLGPPKKP